MKVARGDKYLQKKNPSKQGSLNPCFLLILKRRKKREEERERRTVTLAWSYLFHKVATFHQLVEQIQFCILRLF
jgi:hypothetical protein